MQSSLVADFNSWMCTKITCEFESFNKCGTLLHACAREYGKKVENCRKLASNQESQFLIQHARVIFRNLFQKVQQKNKKKSCPTSLTSCFP
jgi:hypothetical protein